VKQFFTFFAGVCALAVLAINVHGEQAGGPKVGDKAPAFEAKNEEGKVWNPVTWSAKDRRRLFLSRRLHQRLHRPGLRFPR